MKCRACGIGLFLDENERGECESCWRRATRHLSRVLNWSQIHIGIVRFVR